MGKNIVCFSVGCVLALVVALTIFTACDKTEKDNKLGDVTPWGSNALNQICGPSSKGDMLISDGTNWHLISKGTAGQVLTITTNANYNYVQWQ